MGMILGMGMRVQEGVVWPEVQATEAWAEHLTFHLQQACTRAPTNNHKVKTQKQNTSSSSSSDRTDTYKLSSPRTCSAPETPETSHAYPYTPPWALFGAGGGGVPLGPYGRQVLERGQGPLGYWPETASRWKEYGLEEGKGGIGGSREEREREREPVEMDASDEVERGRRI